jgi:hypothetical protein
MNPLPRPHLKQRFVALVENFGAFAARAFTDVFAMFKKCLFWRISRANFFNFTYLALPN